MKGLEKKLFILALSGAVLFINGCATMEKVNKVDELEKRIDRLTEAVKERDEQINELRESLDSQERQLQERDLSYERSLEKLYKELNQLRAGQKALEKREPNLK